MTTYNRMNFSAEIWTNWKADTKGIVEYGWVQELRGSFTIVIDYSQVSIMNLEQCI